MPRTSTSHRRLFLKQAAATFALPMLATGALAAPTNRRVRHASFGAGGMAKADLTAIASHPQVDLVAVADVDSQRLAALQKERPTIRVYQDWRVLLDKEAGNLDSVNVSTPDHMHAPIAASALERGLHVYGQKPLTHNVSESRRLTELARQHKRITQMGIQVHSSVEYRSAVELIQSGAIGLVKEVHTWSNKNWGDDTARPDRSDPVPESLDWDGWLGVAEARSFIGSGYYHPGNWRKRLDFGTGTFGDMGCHIYDPVFKALALTAPVSVRSEGPTPNTFNWANNAVVHYTFPRTRFTANDTVTVTWYDGDQRPPQEIQSLAGSKLPGQGSIFIGAKGVMVLPHVGKPILLPESDFRDYALLKLEPINHWHQFVDAVRGEPVTTTAGFDYSGPLTEAILLGGVASRFPKETLQWNAAALQFTNRPEANRFLSRKYRPGFDLTVKS
ncbi:MAG: Gfo/Idh/MocA family oxidoreductase [Planctomycetes bacterium]|nr:Gfo/Idh/MocA family oxidoreductase [Planctomycetota bacterium]